MRKTITAALLAVSLAGCGTATMTRLDVKTVDSAAFRLVDERTAEQRTSSTNTHSYGNTTRLGDDAITPSPLALTRTWLSKTVPDWLRNKVVALREFTVQISVPNAEIDEARFQSAVMSTPGGIVAAPLARLFITGIENMRTPKSVTATIVVSAEGRDYSATDGRSFQGRVTEENIGTVVSGALDALLKAIEKPATENVSAAKNAGTGETNEKPAASAP